MIGPVIVVHPHFCGKIIQERIRIHELRKLIEILIRLKIFMSSKEFLQIVEIIVLVTYTFRKLSHIQLSFGTVLILVKDHIIFIHTVSGCKPFVIEIRSDTVKPPVFAVQIYDTAAGFLKCHIFHVPVGDHILKQHIRAFSILIQSVIVRLYYEFIERIHHISGYALITLTEDRIIKTLFSVLFAGVNTEAFLQGTSSLLPLYTYTAVLG